MLLLKTEFFLFIGCYAAIVGLFMFGKWLAMKKSERRRIQYESQLSKSVSVVIPFRNEEKNLHQIIQAIQNLKSYPLEFLFVNDHSCDQSIEVLKQTAWNCPIKLLELQKGYFGKKEAIKMGVLNAKGSFVLTWDADVIPLESYFLELEKFIWSDLNILPVEMNDSSWVGGFFAWDYQLQSQTSLALSGLKRPITASGANFLFEKSSFLEVQIQRNDAGFFSGDDQFLLSAFRESKKSVQNIVSNELVVITKPPQTFKDGLSQRARWLGKSNAVKDNFATIFGLCILLVQLSYYMFAFYEMIQGNFLVFVLLILLKGELDSFICSYKFQAQFNSIRIFLYELAFPAYILVLVFWTIFKKPYWKGRAIKKPL